MAARTKGRLSTPITDTTTVAIRPRGGGRPFSTATNLGKLMTYRGFTVVSLCAEAQSTFGHNNGINNRSMSDYLNGHKDISDKHRGMLARVLGVRPELV